MTSPGAEVGDAHDRGADGLAERAEEPGDTVALRHQLARRVGDADREVQDLVDHRGLRRTLQGDEHLVGHGDEGLPQDIHREPVGARHPSSSITRFPIASRYRV